MPIRGMYSDVTLPYLMCVSFPQLHMPHCQSDARVFQGTPCNTSSTAVVHLSCTLQTIIHASHPHISRLLMNEYRSKRKQGKEEICSLVYVPNLWSPGGREAKHAAQRASSIACRNERNRLWSCCWIGQPPGKWPNPFCAACNAGPSAPAPLQHEHMSINP